MEEYVQKQMENQKKQEILKGNNNAEIDKSVFEKMAQMEIANR